MFRSLLKQNVFRTLSQILRTSSTVPGDRIAKVIARSGICSRREAESLIESKKVTVNGSLITSPALNVGPTDQITVDGHPLPEAEGPVLLVHHKKRGVMCTHSDPEGRLTVFEALEKKGLPRLMSVGRLDYNTEGLLLLTNNGDLKRFLELPKTGLMRKYRARVCGDIPQYRLAELQKGVQIDRIKYAPMEVELEKGKMGLNKWVTISLAEGKNREVRRVLEYCGVQVTRLIRTQYGPYILRELPAGETAKAPVKGIFLEFLQRMESGSFDGPVPKHLTIIPPAESKEMEKIRLEVEAKRKEQKARLAQKSEEGRAKWRAAAEQGVIADTNPRAKPSLSSTKSTRSTAGGKKSDSRAKKQVRA